MPRRELPNYYADEYMRITELVAIERKEWEIPCETVRQGNKLRGQYYAFVGALYRTADRVTELERQQAQEKHKFGAAITEVSALQKKQAEYAGLAVKVAVAVRPLPDGSGRALLVFYHRDDSWQGNLLRQGRELVSARKAEVEAKLLAELAPFIERVAIKEGEPLLGGLGDAGGGMARSPTPDVIMIPQTRVRVDYRELRAQQEAAKKLREEQAGQPAAAESPAEPKLPEPDKS